MLCAVGTSPPEPPCRGVDAEATAALVAASASVAAAAATGAISGELISRFVLISALGVGDTLDCLPHASHDVLAPWLERKRLAEESLLSSGLSWTILRPGPLTDAPPSGAALATLDAATGRAFSPLSRADLAAAAYAAAVAPAAERRVLALLDGDALVIAAPFLRALEAWEAPPFDEFAFV